jgi:hypothetical protein
MAKDRSANFFRPTLFRQDFVAGEGMLFERRMFFVIEVMQQTGNGILFNESVAFFTNESLQVGLVLTVGAHARLNRERMFQQA